MAYVSSMTGMKVLIENAPNANGTTNSPDAVYGDTNVLQIKLELYDKVGHCGQPILKYHHH